MSWSVSFRPTSRPSTRRSWRRWRLSERRQAVWVRDTPTEVFYFLSDLTLDQSGLRKHLKRFCLAVLPPEALFTCVCVCVGIPHVAVVTNIDTACGETQKNLRNVYRSKHLKKKVSTRVCVLCCVAWLH